MSTRRQRNPELFQRVVFSPGPTAGAGEDEGAQDVVTVTVQLSGDTTPLPANRRSTLPYGECPAVTLDRLDRSRARLRWRPTA